MENRVELFDLGHIPYKQAWDIQRGVHKQLIDQKLTVRDNPNLKKKIPDSLIFVEHPHVYTLGKSGDAANLLKGAAELKNIDAEFIENDRGGDITYHGPGQIVGYPILDLDRYFTDVHKYLRYLEEVIIKTCADYGVEAGRIESLTGVWVGDEKICAMGIRCSRWITMHGFAFNVNTDLTYFDHIVPCGIRDKNVTSLSKILGETINMHNVKTRIAHHFSKEFSADISDTLNIKQLLLKLEEENKA